MGYYTRYDITANRGEVIEAIEELSGYEDFYEVKWYDCRDHMKALSLKFPGEWLIVYGEGEESGDIWRAFYKDGVEVYQRATMSFPDAPFVQH